MYVKMADPSKLSASGVGGYVDNKLDQFHILNRDWMKDSSFVNYILPRFRFQNLRHRNLRYVYDPEIISGKVRSAGGKELPVSASVCKF